MRLASDDGGRETGGLGFCGFSELVLAFVGIAAAASARSDDLPTQLAATARLIPIDQDGRLVCMNIDGLADDLRTPAIVGGQGTSVAGPESYSASTRGAYLGDGPAGTPAPPFVQALLDAGAAERLALTWTERVRSPATGVPRLLDTGTPRAASGGAPAPLQFVDRDVEFRGDAYVVTGADRSLFAVDRGSYVAVVPPAVTAPAADRPTAGSPPPGVWPTTRVCYTLVPDRVLEYSDVVDHGNGVREVGAAILFRPDRLPAWISDPRVIDTLQPNMKPLDVRIASFRDDGDGWRPLAFNLPRLWGRTHIVGPAP